MLYKIDLIDMFQQFILVFEEINKLNFFTFFAKIFLLHTSTTVTERRTAVFQPFRC
jgi:hypothetical protein